MIIVTGFGSYGKYSINLSSIISKTLQFDHNNFQILRGIIPVNWSQSIRTYKRLLSESELEPELVILLGIHSGSKICLEKFGWNFKIGDDNKNKLKCSPIKLYSPLLMKTTLNLNKIYLNLEDKTGISVSHFPGFYLCNYLYYWALYISKKRYPVIFIHIPDKGNINEYTKKAEMIVKSIIKIHFS